MASLTTNRTARAQRIADVLRAADVDPDLIDHPDLIDWVCKAAEVIDVIAGRPFRVPSQETLDAVRVLLRPAHEFTAADVESGIALLEGM